MAKSSITFDGINKKTEALILDAATRALSFRKDALKEWEARVLPRVAAEATRHYQHTVNTLGDILQTGVDGAEYPHSTIDVPTVAGGRETVAISWRPLSQSTLRRKDSGYKKRGGGKAKRSPGASKFWLDRGQLRGAYARLAASQVKVTAKLVRVRSDNGHFKFDVALELSKLPRSIYLNDAIRRSLIEGFEGVDSQGLSLMAGAPKTSPVAGVLRGFWAEARRPLLRPVSRRLGRTMRTSVIKSFKRK